MVGGESDGNKKLELANFRSILSISCLILVKFQRKIYKTCIQTPNLIIVNAMEYHGYVQT